MNTGGLYSLELFCEKTEKNKICIKTTKKINNIWITYLTPSVKHEKTRLFCHSQNGDLCWTYASYSGTFWRYNSRMWSLQALVLISGKILDNAFLRTNCPLSHRFWEPLETWLKRKHSLRCSSCSVEAYSRPTLTLLDMPVRKLVMTILSTRCAKPLKERPLVG